MRSTSLQELSPETLALLKRHNLVQPFVKSQILRETLQDFDINESQCGQVWEEYLSKNNLKIHENLENHLKSIGLEEHDLRWQVELPSRIRLYSSKKFWHKAEARFLTRKEQLDKVVYSLLRVKDTYLARELYLRIAGNEAGFADLASQYSEGPEAQTMGIVGPVPMSQAHPVLKERLRTTKEHELQEPFAIGEWWLVVRLEKYKSAQFDDQTNLQMNQELFEEWINQEILCKIREL